MTVTAISLYFPNVPKLYLTFTGAMIYTSKKFIDQKLAQMKLKECYPILFKLRKTFSATLVYFDPLKNKIFLVYLIKIICINCIQSKLI